MGESAAKFMVLKYLLEDGIRFDIKGSVDGVSVFPDLPKGEPVKDIFIDTNDLKYITSTGIRRWMTWIWEMEKNFPQAKITIERCRPHFLKQIQIVNGFLPKGARVKSAYAEYCCAKCDTIFLELLGDQEPRIRTAMMGENPPHSLTVRCPDCKSAVEFETDPLKSLSFFRR